MASAGQVDYEAMARKVTKTKKLQAVIDGLDSQAADMNVLQVGQCRADLRAAVQAGQIKAIQEQITSLTVQRTYSSPGDHVDAAVPRSDGPTLVQSPPPPPPAQPRLKWPPGVPEDVMISAPGLPAGPDGPAIPQEPWRVQFLVQRQLVFRCLLCPKNQTYDDWVHRSHYDSISHKKQVDKLLLRGDWQANVLRKVWQDLPPLFDGNVQ